MSMCLFLMGISWKIIAIGGISRVCLQSILFKGAICCNLMNQWMEFGVAHFQANPSFRVTESIEMCIN